MTDLLLAADTPSAIEHLRDERDSRPERDTTSAAHLRGALEAAAFAVVDPDQPLAVRPSTLRAPGGAIDFSLSPLAQVRGLLVTHGLRVLVADPSVEVTFDAALSAWRAESPWNDLVRVVEGLDRDDRARLAAGVEAHLATLSATIGVAAPAWMPRVGVRAAATLAGGRLVLRDVIDLMIGTTTTPVASVVLVDVTTSPLDAFADRLSRYHALVQTVRTSSVPWRTAVLSTATGEFRVEDVDVAMLTQAVDDLLEVLDAEAAR